MSQPTQLGPYQIKRKLGAGGMGDVYEALNQQTGKAAALKVLPDHLGRQPGFRSRFEVEIETLRRLDHPNIVKILGFGQQQDTLFYAMELVEGRSLDDNVARGQRLPWREVVDIAQQLCKALKHAHDRGIIHRDIKPANIMRLADGQVKLADFGIAQLYGVSGLTVDGGVVGTASYLSPEQADGLKTTPRSDLYSLGATLYALLTGRPPFTGKTLPELLRLQRTAMPPAPGLLVSDIPSELDAVIMGLLAKEPSQRIAAPMMLARSLQAVQDADDLKQSTTAPLAPDSPAAEHVEQPSRPRDDSPDVTQASGMDVTLDSGAAGSSSAPASTDESEATYATDAQGAADATYASQISDATQATQATQMTQASQLASPSAARGSAAMDASAAHGSAGASGVTAGDGTFMTTQQAAEFDRQRQAQLEVPQPREIPIGWIALLLGVAVLCVVIYIVLQPPTADELYEQITAGADQGSSEALIAIGPALEEFQSLYPDDPRQTSLLVIQRRVDQARSVRLAPIVQRHFDTGQSSLPMARMRDAALLHATTQPELAVAKLQAIIALYEGDDTLDDQQKSVLEDIRHRLEDMQTSMQQQRATDLMLLRQKLQQAQSLAQSEPARSREMALAIITLFGDKPWASEMVAQARTLANAE